MNENMRILLNMLAAAIVTLSLIVTAVVGVSAQSRNAVVPYETELRIQGNASKIEQLNEKYQALLIAQQRHDEKLSAVENRLSSIQGYGGGVATIMIFLQFYISFKSNKS